VGDENEWIRTGRDGSNVISTVPLRQLLGKLADINPQSSQLKHIKSCLAFAEKIINLLSLSESSLKQSVDLLAIAVLYDTIEKSLGVKKDAYRAGGRLALGAGEYLQTRMLDDGWCTHDIHRVAHQFDLPSLYLSSNLDRPEPQTSHKNCTAQACKAFKLDESKYLTLHNTPACNGKCGSVGVSQDELAAILLSGRIPLIQYDEERDPSNIKLIPASAGTPYVAISHVWSHGLGNPVENSLPRCQLARISEFVNNLPGGNGNCRTLFWMDTICFPVHHADAANAALKFMRRTYKDADRVLVLDRYLTTTEAKPLLRTECLVRIICCNWTRRLWTLQEGALARVLYFQFSDQAIDIESLTFHMNMEMTSIRHDRSLEYLPIYSIISELWEIWKTIKIEEPRHMLNYLAGGLRWRATSVEADEALCLATLGGLDIEDIINGPEESRMSRFWSALPSISLQAIFWSGERLTQDGFRWAPSTFLSQPDAIFQDLDRKPQFKTSKKNLVSLTDRGLQFWCAGLLLNTWRSPLGKDIFVRMNGRDWFNLRRIHSAILHPKLDDNDHEDPCRSLALLMKTDVTEAFHGDTPEKSVTCILASIYDVDEEEGIIYANTEDTAFLTRLGRTIAGEAPGEFLDKVVKFCELQLGPVEASEAETEAPLALTPGDAKISQSPDHMPPALVDASGLHLPNVEVHVAEGPAGRDELLARMRSLLSEDEELRTARIRARDEDGRLAVDKDGIHYLFDGVELSDDQKWCLD
jgi:hypothetical protein